MKCVLLVDDDHDFHFLCEMIIKRSDDQMQLLQAFDGIEALDLLRDGNVKPDVILLDINMPRMNGHEFLEAYEKIAPGVIPVIAMLTSSDQDHDRDKAFRYSFVKDYLVKPFSKNHLDKLKSIVASVAAAG